MFMCYMNYLSIDILYRKDFLLFSVRRKFPTARLSSLAKSGRGSEQGRNKSVILCHAVF